MCLGEPAGSGGSVSLYLAMLNSRPWFPHIPKSQISKFFPEWGLCIAKTQTLNLSQVKAASAHGPALSQVCAAAGVVASGPRGYLTKPVLVEKLVEELCPSASSSTASAADIFLRDLRARLAELAPEQRAPFCKREVDKLQAGVGDTRSFVHSKKHRRVSLYPHIWKC